MAAATPSAAAVARLQVRVAAAAADFEAEVARAPVRREVGVGMAGVARPLREEKRKLLHDKAYVARESLLSAMLSSGDESYRAIYHAAIATLIWLGVKLVLQDYSRRDVIIDFGLLTWAFDKFDVVLRAWLTCSGICFLMVPLMQYVAAAREPAAALRLAYFVYGAALVALYAVAMTACLSHALPPASGLIVMCEVVRMSMKMHAYVREKVVHGLRRQLAGIMPPDVLAAVAPAVASPARTPAVASPSPSDAPVAGRAPCGGEEIAAGVAAPPLLSPIPRPAIATPATATAAAALAPTPGAPPSASAVPDGPGLDAAAGASPLEGSALVGSSGDSGAATPIPGAPGGVATPLEVRGVSTPFSTPGRSLAGALDAVGGGGAGTSAAPPAFVAATGEATGVSGEGEGDGEGDGEGEGDGSDRKRGSGAAAAPSAATIALFRSLTAFADFLPPSAAKYGVSLASLQAARADITIGDTNQEIGRFVYFLFAPTLVYRDEYPRSGGPINWVRAGIHTANLAGVVLYTYVITRSLLVPLLEPVPPKHPIDLVLLVQGAMVPSILVYLLIFFGVLHSWLNVWAELLRFSDRQFYTSWWTATSWSAYYRRWNLVVGDFLHSYVYNDIQRAGGRRQAAEAGVFLISAALHEVIIACSYRFWYPALLLMFGGPGVFFMSLTRRFAARFANVFMWLMLSVGLGLLTVMYSREQYARYGHEWVGMPGVPATPPYVFNPALHPSEGWGVLDWVSYVMIPRSWLEFMYTNYKT